MSSAKKLTKKTYLKKIEAAVDKYNRTTRFPFYLSNYEAYRYLRRLRFLLKTKIYQSSHIRKNSLLAILKDEIDINSILREDYDIKNLEYDESIDFRFILDHILEELYPILLESRYRLSSYDEELLFGERSKYIYYVTRVCGCDGCEMFGCVIERKKIKKELIKQNPMYRCMKRCMKIKEELTEAYYNPSNPCGFIYEGSLMFNDHSIGK